MQQLETYIERFKAERGLKSADTMTRFLKPFIEFAGVRVVTPALLDDFSTHLRKRGLKASSANRVIGTTKAYLRWLRKRGSIQIARDDLDDWQQFKTERPQPQVLSTQEIRALLRAAARKGERSSMRWCLYLTMGLGLGARHGELCAVSAMDVNTESEEVLIDGTKTGVQRRAPYWHSPALKRILEHTKEHLTWRVFVPQMRSESWYRLCKLAGIERKPRSILRSTAAAYIASGSGLSEYLLTQWFGHGSNVAAKHYRQPLHNVEGKTVEEWYNAVEAFKAVAERVEAHRWQKGR